MRRNILFKVHRNLLRLIRDWGKGSGYVPVSYQRMTTKTIKRYNGRCSIWCFYVSAVVRNKVTKTVPPKQQQQQKRNKTKQTKNKQIKRKQQQQNHTHNCWEQFMQQENRTTKELPTPPLTLHLVSCLNLDMSKVLSLKPGKGQSGLGSKSFACPVCLIQ